MWVPPPPSVLSEQAITEYLQQALQITVPVQLDRMGAKVTAPANPPSSVRSGPGTAAGAGASPAPSRSSPRRRAAQHARNNQPASAAARSARVGSHNATAKSRASEPEERPDMGVTWHSPRGGSPSPTKHATGSAAASPTSGKGAAAAASANAGGEEEALSPKNNKPRTREEERAQCWEATWSVSHMVSP
eukprot:COSAG05_NODE_465_length_9537_cov_21.527086_4_plen_190_part_00